MNNAEFTEVERLVAKIEVECMENRVAITKLLPAAADNENLTAILTTMLEQLSITAQGAAILYRTSLMPNTKGH